MVLLQFCSGADFVISLQGTGYLQQPQAVRNSNVHKTPKQRLLY